MKKTKSETICALEDYYRALLNSGSIYEMIQSIKAWKYIKPTLKNKNTEILQDYINDVKSELEANDVIPDTQALISFIEEHAEEIGNKMEAGMIEPRRSNVERRLALSIEPKTVLASFTWSKVLDKAVSFIESHDSYDITIENDVGESN